MISAALRVAGQEKVEARPTNWLVPSLLLMLKDRSSYGYQLMERLTALGIEETDLSTVYRALRRMEKKGMVNSGWETPKGGPARRMYSITEDGEAYLESWINSLEQCQQMIERFFQISMQKARTEAPGHPRAFTTREEKPRTNKKWNEVGVDTKRDDSRNRA